VDWDVYHVFGVTALARGQPWQAGTYEQSRTPLAKKLVPPRSTMFVPKGLLLVGGALVEASESLTWAPGGAGGPRGSGAAGYLLAPPLPLLPRIVYMARRSHASNCNRRS
jgi:hypothetical protein